MSKLTQLHMFIISTLHQEFGKAAKTVRHYDGKATTHAATFNLGEFLVDGKIEGKVYTYKGSLTTKPCSEQVLWFVSETPIEIRRKVVSILQVVTTFVFWHLTPYRLIQ